MVLALNMTWCTVNFIRIWILNPVKPVAGSQWHWGLRCLASIFGIRLIIFVFGAAAPDPKVLDLAAISGTSEQCTAQPAQPLLGKSTGLHGFGQGHLQGEQRAERKEEVPCRHAASE